nr:hypothetical protein CFP56_18612 [Quercus suber]
MINEVYVGKALVDTGSSLNVIPLSTLVATGISQRKIQGLPMEITKFGEGCEHTIGHIQLELKGCLNGKLIHIPANLAPFNQSEAHYLGAAFYDQLTISGEDAIAKPLGTLLPSWEDIKEGSKVDLRDLLERRKKYKKRKETTHDAPTCEKIQLLDGCTSYCL